MSKIHKSAFVISLDLELIWGVRDHTARESYSANILGVRKAVPQILDVFEKFGVRATWATVGFLFAESRDELLHYLPAPELRPTYDYAPFSNYNYLGEVGANEKQDPYAFAPSLIKLISQAPGQEIGTHTMSHYYCLESGQSEEAFAADLKAASNIARARGVKLQSIVFPRNQYSGRHLDICHQHGIHIYRGNAHGSAYQARKTVNQDALIRVKRLAGSYIGLMGSQVHNWTTNDAIFQRGGGLPRAKSLKNLPASLFLRPNAGVLKIAHPLHLRRIKQQMNIAAEKGKMFHLWWHPHNFGVNLQDNLHSLEEIASHYLRLNERYGMQSLTMKEAA